MLLTNFDTHLWSRCVWPSLTRLWVWVRLHNCYILSNQCSQVLSTHILGVILDGNMKHQAKYHLLQTLR